MQVTTGGGEEVQRVENSVGFRIWWRVDRVRPLSLGRQHQDRLQPSRYMQVAQPAGTLFQVGFQMKDGVAEAQMAGASDFRQALHQDIRLACYKLWQALFMETLKQPGIAAQKAAVEQRDGELDIVGVEACALVEGARRRADPQAGVPHFLAHAAHRVLHPAAKSVVLSQEQKVNVGMRKECAATEATRCGQRETAADGCRDVLLPELQRQLVHKLRAVAQQGAAGAGRFKPPPQTLELLPVQCARAVFER